VLGIINRSRLSRGITGTEGNHQMKSRVDAPCLRFVTTTSRWAVAVLTAHAVSATAYAGAMPTKFSTHLTATGTVINPKTHKPVPRLLPGSTFAFTDDGTATVTLKGVRDASGALVTTTKNATDPFAVSGDEYIVTVRVAAVDAPDSEAELAIPVELKNGNGKTVLNIQYLTDQGLNYLHNVAGVNTSGALVAKSILVWTPNATAITSAACTSGALTRPNTAPSWVSGTSANYSASMTGPPPANPCTSGLPTDAVGLAGVTVKAGGGIRGGGCQIDIHRQSTALWLLALAGIGLLTRRGSRSTAR